MRSWGTALFTPGDGIDLGGLPAELVPAVVEALIDGRPQTVTGLPDAALRYAETTSQPFHEVERTRLHKLDVFVAHAADGAARRAVAADVATLVPLLGAYRAEVARVGSPAEDRRWLEDRIRRDRFGSTEVESSGWPDIRARCSEQCGSVRCTRPRSFVVTGTAVR
ncbi:hypothetical protein [Kribbella sp. NPDC049227]|uniref:hypothetical protein n=1 Tax=Kribbella sp. NPDC049227 TaxID=3364113 RepID=UPI0037205AE5